MAFHDHTSSLCGTLSTGSHFSMPTVSITEPVQSSGQAKTHFNYTASATPSTVMASLQSHGAQLRVGAAQGNLSSYEQLNPKELVVPIYDI